MSESLGSWRNAPLVYLVMEIQFPELNDFDSCLNKLSDKLINLYPISSNVQGSTVALGPDGSITIQQTKMHHRVDVNRSAGVAVTPNTLSLHVSKYYSSPDLFEKLEELLTLFADTFPDRPILRTGLRLIDVVVPTETLKSVESFVKPQYQAPKPPADTELRLHISVATFAHNKTGTVCTLKSYGTNAVPSPGLLPADLTQINLQLFGPAPLAIQVINNKQPVGLIDTDSSSMQVEIWSIPRVIERFKEHKEFAHVVFLDAITDDAITVWK